MTNQISNRTVRNLDAATVREVAIGCGVILLFVVALVLIAAGLTAGTIAVITYHNEGWVQLPFVGRQFVNPSEFLMLAWAGWVAIVASIYIIVEVIRYYFF